MVRALRAVSYGFSAKTKLKVPGLAEFEAAFIAKDMIDREEKLVLDPLLQRSLYFDAFEALATANSPLKLDVWRSISDDRNNWTERTDVKTRGGR